jgi:uncharacterized membrane protein YhaH (DUF805 family)
MTRTNYPRRLTRQDYWWGAILILAIALIVFLVWTN